MSAKQLDDVDQRLREWVSNSTSKLATVNNNTPEVTKHDFQVSLQKFILRLLYHVVNFQVAALRVLGIPETAGALAGKSHHFTKPFNPLLGWRMNFSLMTWRHILLPWSLCSTAIPSVRNPPSSSIQPATLVSS
jgi:hypothetical protein